MRIKQRQQQQQRQQLAIGIEAGDLNSRWPKNKSS